MKIISTEGQLERMRAGSFCNGAFPNYTVRRPLPDDVVDRLFEMIEDMDFDQDRDFINDDGGYIVVCEDLPDFTMPMFGLLGKNDTEIPTGEMMEAIDTEDGPWWITLWMQDNATGIIHVFKESDIPEGIEKPVGVF